MKINIALKHAGNLARRVSPTPVLIENRPRTLRELITECVKASLRAYRERASAGDRPTEVGDEDFRGMEELGRFAFGPLSEFRDVPDEKAIKTALDAYSDGLVRIFQNDTELCVLDGEIKISEDDVFTFVRLAFLSGRTW